MRDNKQSESELIVNEKYCYKYKYKNNYLNISFITDNIIAMNNPHDFDEKEMNNLKEFIYEKYNNNVTIISLCNEDNKIFEEDYFCDIKYKNSNKIIYKIFLINDHECPTLNNLYEIIKYIEENIKKNKIVIIHCHKGKGRTGLIISSYLLYKNICKDSEEARKFFNLKRCSNNSCIKNPTQKKYLKYFEMLLKNSNIQNEIFFNYKKYLKSIIIEGIDKLYENLEMILIINEKKSLQKNINVIYDNNEIEIFGDIKIYFIKKEKIEELKNKKLFSDLFVNTKLFKSSEFMIILNIYFEFNNNNSQTYKKEDINKIYKNDETSPYKNILITLNVY
jgi:protein-tyrosine phosphatase